MFKNSTFSEKWRLGNYADLRDMFKNGIIRQQKSPVYYADFAGGHENGIISEGQREEYYADLRDMLKNGIIRQLDSSLIYADFDWSHENGIISEGLRDENYADLRDMFKNGIIRQQKSPVYYADFARGHENGIISEGLREGNYADLRDMFKNGIMFFFTRSWAGLFRAGVKARVSTSSKTPQLFYAIQQMKKESAGRRTHIAMLRIASNHSTNPRLLADHTTLANESSRGEPAQSVRNLGVGILSVALSGQTAVYVIQRI